MENKIGNVTISITNKCNYLCSHCSFDSGIKKIEECTTKEWINFLEEAKEKHSQGLDISGGEPTLRKDLSEIIMAGSSLGYKTKLLTNGTYLTDSLLQELKINGLESIAISLDGSNSETHNKIRGKGEKDFNLILEKLKLVQEYGFLLKVNTVVVNSNLNDIPNLIALCEKINVNEHRICYFTPTGRGKDNPDGVHPIRWLDFIRRNLLDFKDSKRVYIGMPFIEKNYSHNKLDASCWLSQGIFPIHVLPKGDIYACSIKTSVDRPIGNLKENGLKEKIKKQKLTQSCCFDYSLFFDGIIDNKEITYVCPLRKFKMGEVV